LVQVTNTGKASPEERHYMSRMMFLVGSKGQVVHLIDTVKCAGVLIKKGESETYCNIPYSFLTVIKSSESKYIN
jgi:hypothetical protein